MIECPRAAWTEDGPRRVGEPTHDYSEAQML